MSGADSALNVAVIGAGWAGCSASVELASQGHRVTVFEASRVAGGRARRLAVYEHELDNGQHILLGAYQSTLALMSQLGVDLDKAFLRLPMQMCYPLPSGMHFETKRLPAPLHLAWALMGARGLDRNDKWALARFSSSARWMGWRLDNDISVTKLLETHEQTERLYQLLWRPLCIAALNTPPERASANVFLAVLRDSLGAKRSASDMLLPRVSLGKLLPEPALDWLKREGATVHLGQHVRGITPVNGRWRLQDDQASHEFDCCVVATPPHAAQKLIQAHLPETDFAALGQESITTCYLGYDSTTSLQRPFFALADDPLRQHWGQFVFDRGQLNQSDRGVLSVVVSASQEALHIERHTLGQQIALQLANQLGMPLLAAPRWQQIVSEKRATFSCTPGLKRPSNTTRLPGLFLAGDYTEGDYPATLEMAVRSGQSAVRALLAQNRHCTRP